MEKKVCLCLTWVNHTLRTVKGGKKVVRDETYSELVDRDGLLSRVLKRVRSANGSDSPLVGEAFNEYHAAVKDALAAKADTKRTVLNKDGRKLFTYIIRPLKLAFDVGDGCQYVVRENGKVERISGTPTATKLAPNLGDPDAVIASPLPKPDNKKGKKAKGKNKNKKGIDKPKAGDYSVDNLHNSRMSGGEPIPPKEKEVKKDLTSKTKASKVSVKEEKPKADKPEVKEVSKAVQKELDKFKLDINNLPSDKPKGFPKKVWRKLTGV